jgi:hypothetical protein
VVRAVNPDLEAPVSRISRILRSLRLLGLEAESRALYERLQDFYTRRRFPIPSDTFRYWTEAAPPA